jgi:DNA-binding transcriptional MerR regulator/methylmalonyl-CoA mutase cobalamin-binding subunit
MGASMVVQGGVQGGAQGGASPQSAGSATVAALAGAGTPTGLFRIQAVSERTGIPAATLRAWERRYGIPSPARTESAYRLYTESDVQLVVRLNELCAAGMAPAEAARLLRAQASAQVAAEEAVPDAGSADAPRAVRVAEAAARAVEGARAAEGRARGAAYEVPAPFTRTPTSAPDLRDAFQLAVHRILDAVARFDPECLDAEVAQALALGSASTIFDRIIAPVQREVGERWHEGSLSVGQEHLATEVLGCAVRSLIRLVQPMDSERLVVLACFADEDHAMPLYGVAFRFAAWGYRTVILGARTPPAALAAAVAALEPDFVGLSLTLAPAPYQTRELVEAYAQAIGARLWAVGGRAAPIIASHVESRGGVIVDGDFGELRERLDRLTRGR